MARKPAILFLVSVLVGTVVPSVAEVTVSNEMARLSGIYDSELKKVLADAAVRLKAWPENYSRELTDLRAKAQQDGDLDGILAIDGELKRFKAEPTLPDKVVGSASDAVRKVQLRYREQPLQIALARDQQVLDVTARYRDRLAAMQRDLTRSGDIRSALLIKQEMGRVAALPAVTAAEFSAAERPAQTPETGSAAQEPVKPAPPKSAVQDAAAPKPAPRKVELTGGFGLAEKATGLATSAFRPLAMNNTEAARIPKARVEMAIYEREPSDSTASTSMYGSYRGKSGETVINTRATVRAVGSSDIEGATLVVQWFTRDVGGKSGGRIAPDEAMAAVTPLPTLTSQGMTLDGPPFGSYSSTFKYRSVYHSSTSRYGREFYGLIASIFSADGTLLYQGASVNGLDKLGATKVPAQASGDMRRGRPWRGE